MDYGDKLPLCQWYIFTPPRRYKIPPPLTLCPASVNTPRNKVPPKEWFDAYFEQQPLGRFAEVDEIAPTAVLLASDAGAYYTGASMNMNGGDVMI